MASVIETQPQPDFKPLKLYDPLFILLYISFFSPFILIFSIMIYSIIFQNYKGFIYLAFIFALTFLRTCIYQTIHKEHTNEVNKRMDICDSVYTTIFSGKEQTNGNDTYSIAILSFTFFYMCVYNRWAS